MPKPACVPCKRFYRPLKNGVRVNEQMPTVDWAEPGLKHADFWAPYKIWNADLWHCEGCGHQLIVGYGNHPESERHLPHFEELLTTTTIEINDC